MLRGVIVIVVVSVIIGIIVYGVPALSPSLGLFGTIALLVGLFALGGYFISRR